MPIAETREISSGRGDDALKIETAEFVHAAHTEEALLRDGLPQLAFVGRSNVGKSSLLNRLLGRKLARTSSTPGRTRSINYFLINRRFYFVDLPGYGYARAGKNERRRWGQLVERYFERAAAAASGLPVAKAAGARGQVAVVLLVDGKVGVTPLDEQAHEYLAGIGLAPTVVATKIDRVGRSRCAAALAAVSKALGLGRGEVIAISSRTGEGMKELWTTIDAILSAS